MKLFKRKNRKKLTTDQLISRWSVVVLVVVLGIGGFFTIKNTMKEMQESTTGNTAVFDYLNEKYYIDTLIDNPVSADDKSTLKTKTTDAGLDLFKNNYITQNKYLNPGNANNFSLTANESAFLANEIMAVSQNKYGLDYNQINISYANGETIIKYVVSMRFTSFCGITSAERDMYKELGYNLPSTMYATTYATISGDNTTYSTSFNSLTNEKNKEIVKYMNSRNQYDKIEQLCHTNFISLLTDFCEKTNTTYAFSSNCVNFLTIFGN